MKGRDSMAGDLVQVVGDRVSGELARVNGMSDDELLAIASKWLDQQPSAGLYAGTPADRFKDWLQSTVLPHLRKMGECGQRSWDYICDPESALSKDRIASIALTLAVLSGLQELHVETLIAIVVLAIRVKSRNR
jgi:hypothetical protein